MRTTERTISGRVTSISTNSTYHIGFDEALRFVGAVVCPMACLTTETTDIVIPQSTVHECQLFQLCLFVLVVIVIHRDE